ncbi:hypothetical protein [Arthrobacter sp. M4]|uniref:hypothetical protein n=1 Tax=Arthrobacter sp. M4 TaxID=218160 RepID=UPI001CDC0CE9|nr:hypothetical protein [Arthrobacter sp. M4]MCA4133118.1 hypothetical protein [Arthrobacter sp. M4]
MSGITLFLDGGRKGFSGSWGEGNNTTDFPSGQLTSTAWAGWWHDEVAGLAERPATAAE